MKFPFGLWPGSFVVILSEVAKATKFEKTGPKLAVLFFCAWLAISETAAMAMPSFGKGGSDNTKPPAMDQLNDCNWIVTYRGRTYDLAPLTRDALDRPIETDLRYALERVPEANEHLKAMTQRTHDAKVHSIIASAFLGLLLAARLIKSGEQNPSVRSNFNTISTITGGLFIGEGLFNSWRATRDAKAELVKAVDAFNAESPYKIEPASGGKLIPDGDSFFPREKNAEKK